MPVEKRYNTTKINEDLGYAQNKLINGAVFDVERKQFITDFEHSFDIQAVPGSGKTTALIAKLIILERNIDMIDGGVLVLSHTNKAIDNIKDRLGDICPQILGSNYHFIGTIQSFINDFLAKPYFSLTTCKKIKDIDDEHRIKSMRYGIGRKLLYPFDVKYFNFLSLDTDEEGEFISFPFTKTTESYKKAQQTYKHLEEIGIMRYIDAFLLAKKYITQHTFIKQILQKRFKYIFIDEIQDLEKHQIDIIDDIFFKEGEDGMNSTGCVIQRIGDLNQAIFHEGFDGDGQHIWQQRCYKDTPNPHIISGSHRLHKETAKVVDSFRLDGSPEIACDNSGIHKPTLVVFQQGQENSVKDWFIDQLIQRKFTRNCIDYTNNIPTFIGVDAIEPPYNKKSPQLRYSAIAWTTKNKLNEKTIDKKTGVEYYKRCMEHYFETFSKDIANNRRQREYFDNMLGYINNFNETSNSLSQIRKMILQSMIRPIKSHPNYREQILGISDFLNNLNNLLSEGDYKNFMIKLYLWSKSILNSKRESAELIRIKNEILSFYVSNILVKFPGVIIPSGYEDDVLKDKDNKNVATNKTNHYYNNGYYITLDSVHGVKGQDHEATLYLMTNNRGEDFNYFKYFVLGHNFKGRYEKETKQAHKFFYVGFSRPKQWLCYAICSSIDADTAKLIIDKGWDIVGI